MSDVPFDRDLALAALQRRREENKDKPRIDNARLPTGSPMTYYCWGCGCVSDVKPETFNSVLDPVRHHCGPCKVLHDLDLLPLR